MAGVFTARCHSTSSVCLSVCDVEYVFHRLEYIENNFTAEQLKVPAQIDSNIGDLVNGNTPKLGWNRGMVNGSQNPQYL